MRSNCYTCCIVFVTGVVKRIIPAVASTNAAIAGKIAYSIKYK